MRNTRDKVAILSVMILTLAVSAQAGIVLHYDLEEGTGSTAGDSVGSNDGTLGNWDGGSDPTWVAGKIGDYALDFTGAESDSVGTSWVRSVNPSGLPSGAAIRTMSFWASVDRLSGGDIYAGYGDNSTQQNFQLGESWNNTDEMMVYNWNDDSDTGIGLSSGSWLHLTVSYDGADYTAYLNGDQAVGSNALTLNTSLSAVQLGSATDSGTRQYDGRLDDFAIWDDVLTAPEVNALFEAGNNATLNYDAVTAQQLFDLHDAGSGSGVIGGLTWYYASGLTGTPGDLQVSGSNYSILLDSNAGTGITTVPEPATLGLIGLAGAVLCLRRKRRN